MNTVKLKQISENDGKNPKKIYKIDQEKYVINGKTFKLKKSLSNLSKYLNSLEKNLIDIFDISNECKECGATTKVYFSRNQLSVFKFCSIHCQQHYKKKNSINICPICNKNFLYKQKKKEFYGTCGNKKCISIHKETRKKNIANNHWIKRKDSERIKKQRIKTRIENDIKLNRKYKPWNKGKKNIYSKETIEKIRNATIKQLSEQKFKKTKIEEKIEDFLKKEKINYVYSYILKQRQYDFCLKNYKILIEADGDYWHGNPKIYENLSDRQILKQQDDNIKNRIAKENGYEIIRFWEYDIHKNSIFVKNKIIQKINEKNLF